MKLIKLSWWIFINNKKTIINIALMLFCITGISIVLRIKNIAESASAYSTGPYIERLVSIFSGLIWFCLFGTTIIYFLMIYNKIRENIKFYTLQKFLGFSWKNIIFVLTAELCFVSLISFLLSVFASYFTIQLIMSDQFILKNLPETPIKLAIPLFSNINLYTLFIQTSILFLCILMVILRFRRGNSI